MASSPWAVLLCKFAGTEDEPHDRQYYIDLFTASGRGSMNMVDYFFDNSHGQVEIGGSRVFGWFTLDQTLAQYQAQFSDLANHPERLDAGRNNLLNWAIGKAMAGLAGSDLSDFASLNQRVMVCLNIGSDLFGRVGRAVADTRLDPSLLGQEMGHGYGLAHSMIEGSDQAYMDRWDTMSTLAGLEATNPRWGLVGPGLNAANMFTRGWLLPGRTLEVAEGDGLVTTLRPLHRVDLAGPLAVRVGPYFVELRSPRFWDAGIKRPAVFVHTLNGNTSVLLNNTGGQPELLEHGVFQRGGTKALIDETGGAITVEVLEIDGQAESARVRINYARRRHPWVAGPASTFGGVDVDGGGLIFVNGHVTKVPPHSPLLRILAQVSLAAAAEQVELAPVRDAMRGGALTALAAAANEELARTDALREPRTRLQQ